MFNNLNTLEEIRRRISISHFLEGLLDEDSLSSNVPTHRSSGPDKTQFTHARYLPDCEFRALTKYPGLLETNEEKILTIPFSIHSIKHSDKLVEIYTGIPLVNGFFILANMFSKNEITYRYGWVVGQLTIKQQLLLTLIKLKMGMSDVDISHRFKCSLETVKNTVETWIFTIHEKLFDVAVGMIQLIRAPAKPEKPLILHTITLYHVAPNNPRIPHKTPLEPYTAVLLTKPDGLVVYASKLHRWTGHKREVIHRSGVFDLLMPGEFIIVDSDILSTLAIPQTITAKKIDMDNFRLLATRVDLEKRLKNYAAIRCIPPGLEEHSHIIWQTVVILNNFSKFKRFMC